MNDLKAISFGTLPTPSALFAPCREAGVTADATLRVLRALLNKNRPTDALQLLQSLGFTWEQSKAECPKCHAVGECMCADVEAVAAVLR